MNTSENPIRLVYASMLPENVRNLLKRNDLCATIHHDKVIVYKGMRSTEFGKMRDPLSDENLKKRKYQGKLGPSAKKFISKQLSLWWNSVKFYRNQHIKHRNLKTRKLVFLTVTLPAKQVHSDQIIKRKCLVPFLEKLQYHYDLGQYFWKAEKQKNGNIHFHIIVDTFLDMKLIRKLWNASTNKLNYLEMFAKKHGHFNPPTTDVRLLKDGKRGIKYILKYVTKEDETQCIGGKIWGMNDKLRKIRQYTYKFAKNQSDTFISLIKSDLSNIYHEEHFFVIKINDPDKQKLPKNAFFSLYKAHLYQIFEYLYYDNSKLSDDLCETILDNLDYEELKSISKEFT